ncbi:MAG TPA: efflux RND transporter periplasmic adaptor subunit [Steroidobacteraceae bacterium]|jgi:multidrug efflux system membrane fusion protein|nr:efflux RND transporter periplasmic adaptor subunit [Steroidobacteraceae bacterium]
MNELSKNRKTLWIGALVAAVVLIGWRTVFHKSADAADRKAPPVIAVETAPAAHADVPIYLTGLGTVQAFYTVTVTARVDGELEKVAFTEGQTVHKGDLLAQIDPRPNQAAYEQALATKAKDEAQLGNAKRDLDRYTLLQPQNLASKQTVDTQHAAVDQLDAQIKVDQAVIDNAKTQLEYTRITSPIDGRTGIRLVDPGNIVHAAATTGIVVVTQVQPISVVFTLPEESIAAVNAALAAGPVEVTTLSRDSTTELDRGKLMLVDNEIDQATGTAKLKAVFTNEHDSLWPGQYVNARVLVRTLHDALTIPTSAVQLGPDGPFTYVVKSDSTVEVRPIKIGEDSGGATVVNSGLALNERVVTSNQYRLQAGTHVRVSNESLAAAGTSAAGTHGGKSSSHAPVPMSSTPAAASSMPAAASSAPGGVPATPAAAPIAPTQPGVAAADAVPPLRPAPNSIPRPAGNSTS